VPPTAANDSRSQPTVGVLALQGDVREHVAALEAAAAKAVPVRRARELAQIDGLVLPGGESTTIAKLLDTFELFDPLQRAIADGLPVYGSCAGMILLADRLENPATDARGIPQRTLGGMDVVVRRNAFGRQVDSFEVDLDVAHVVKGGQNPIRTVFIRAPWIESAGPGVEILAAIPETDTTGHAVRVGAGKIVAARQGQLLATAFHPEITGDARVHEYFVNELVSH
jgi:pyridoxal 5'-phosphate synthase pdxT subunit